MNINLGPNPNPASFKSVPMANNTSFYRDFFEAGETFTFGNPQDGDTITAEALGPPNGTPFVSFPGFTFHSSLTFNGQTSQNCWTSPTQTQCGSTSIDVIWIMPLQCAGPGTYQMNFSYNNQIFASPTFTMLPQIQVSFVPGDNVNPIQIPNTSPPQTDTTDYSQLDYEDQMGNFCRFYDSSNHAIRHSTHVCNSPLLSNEQIVTIHQLGCAMTSSAMVLGYHGAFTSPRTLNTFLSESTNDPSHPNAVRGYDSGGNIIWSAVGDYAATRGTQLQFDFTNSQKGFLGTQVCSAGPSVIHVKNNQHWVLTYGQPSDLSTWFLHDPAGGANRNLSVTTPPYNNVFTGTRSFVGASQSFTTDYGMLIRLHSPAELLG